MNGTMKAALIGGMLALPSLASAQTLTMAASAPITSIDPHYHTFTPNESVDFHIFDTLVDMDATSHPIPSLAVSYKLVDDHTWEFKLRPGVKFQNGEPFTAEDVAYSIARVPRVPNSPGSFAIYTKAIVGVDIVDPLTVRLRTAGVYPLVPVDLAQVFMIPHSLGQDPLTRDFDSGKDAIGTGPFRLVSYKSGDRIELERNANYWGKKPAWQHVSIRIIPNDGSRTAALLSGDVDMIEAVPTNDVPRLAGDKRLHLSEINSLRLIYLMLNRSHTDAPPSVTGPNGEKLDHNPLNDLRVRQALSIAINRPAIVKQVMDGAAIPTGQFLPPGSFSYVPDLKPPAYDAARAKDLLKQAGYPNGFRITLSGPNDRYVNDSKIIQAVGQMWQRIGVQTKVDGIAWANFVGHANNQEYAAFLVGWSSSSGEASNPLRALITTFDAAKGMGTVNRGRYSNPQVDTLLTQALATADDKAREKLLQQATRVAMDDVGLIPLHNQKNVWAMRSGLTYAARTDETTRAQDVMPVH